MTGPADAGHVGVSRHDGRAAADLREVTIEPGFVRTADGSALIAAGRTRVICTASVEESVPRWMQGKGRGLGHGRVLDAARLDRASASSATCPRAAPKGARWRSSG